MSASTELRQVSVGGPLGLAEQTGAPTDIPVLLPGGSVTLTEEFDSVPAFGVAVTKVQLDPSADGDVSVAASSQQSITLAPPIALLLFLLILLFGLLAFARVPPPPASATAQCRRRCPKTLTPSVSRSTSRRESAPNRRSQCLPDSSAVLGVTTSVAAQSELSGPTVTLDRYELTPGERVKLTITGFEADYVNMVFCGNEGRRGSVDCNVRSTQARETEDNGAPTAAEMPVTAPPMPCPCIIRVSSTDNQEIAVAPVTLIGHPVADVVGSSPADIPLTVDIVANVAPEGLSRQLRSSLGGATTYDVTVRVANSATFDIDNVAMASTFTRTRYDDVRAIDFPTPARSPPARPGSRPCRYRCRR